MIKRTKGETVFGFFNVIALAALVMIVLLPLLSVVSTSLVSEREIAEKRIVVVPTRPELTAYKYIFRGGSFILNGFKITFFRVVVGTSLNMLFTYFVGYALSRRDLPGRTAFTIILFITMIFSGGLIPYYLIIRFFHLSNTVWVYIVPQLISAWYVLLMRNFIMSIPDSLIESAEIDGADQLTIIMRIVLPLSTPALATLSLFYAVFHWNSWWDAFLFVSKPSLQPIQLVLRNILAQTTVQLDMITGQAEISEHKPPSRAVQNATVIVSTVPIVLLYPFLQKYFIRGIMVGSIKG